jgi:hypothetical protein
MQPMGRLGPTEHITFGEMKSLVHRPIYAPHDVPI